MRLSGEASLTTSAVAARAGVSIGTLYQYFTNTDAILISLADQERRKLGESMVTLLQHPELSSSFEPTKTFIRVVIDSYIGRVGACRQFQLVETAKRQKNIENLRVEFSDVLAKCWSDSGRTTDPFGNKVRAYVMTRAIFGVLQAAALESCSYLQSTELEKAIHLIVLALEPNGFRTTAE